MDKKNTFLNSGIIEQYVMGLTSPNEAAEVEKMAAIYPEVDRKICEMQNCMEQYIRMHEIPPPARAMKRNLSTGDGLENKNTNRDVSQQYISDKVFQLSRWAAGLTGAIVIGLFGMSYLLYQNQSESQEQLAQLSEELQNLKANYNQLQQNNGQVMQQYVVLKDMNTKHIQMEGTAHAPQAKLVIYWNEAHNKVLLNVVNLPVVPHGHQYQIWADVNGQHMDMGLLDAAAENKKLHPLPYVNDCKGIVITLEKEGGSPHPSTDKMYAHGRML